MAISVRQFLNPLNCNEPAYEIPIAYDADIASGASDICSGNGTLTNIYGDYSTLGAIYSNSATGNAANTNICQDGIDAVFVIDYTQSMGTAINGVKTGIPNIINQLSSDSNGNYRVGIVIYDEYGGTSGVTFNYASSTYYQDSIPADQKYTNIGTGHTQHFVCMEKMNLVGNSTSAQAALNVLNSNNSSTGMALGNGASSPEPGGLASYEVAANAFAGQWRADALKLIIHITDNHAGGDDDVASSADQTYFQNTLEPYFENNQIQFYHNTSRADGDAVDEQTYKYLADNTLPAGRYIPDLTYTSDWYSTIVTTISTLCAETTTYTCDPAPAGWYADTPIVAGTTVAYYWNGSAWTNSYACPAPQYTVTVDVNDTITNGHVNDILANHPNYLDLDTFTFTGEAGDQFTATVSCDANSGYQNLSVNLANISDSNIISATVNNLTDEVNITVTIPSSAQAESLDVTGSASAIPRTMRVDVINGTTDTQDSLGQTQSPAGTIAIVAETPESNWTDASTFYSGVDAKRYEFTSIAGVTHTIDVNFAPSPSDYGLNVTSITPSYLNSNGVGTNTAVQNAFANMVLTTGASNPQWAGQFIMPATDGWVRIYVLGQVNQPVFRYTLYVSENINGAQMVSGDSQFLFEGYTGQQFNASSLVEASAGFQNPVVSSVSMNLLYGNNEAITTGPTVVAPPGNGMPVTSTVTMPSGGGTGGYIIGGSATAIQYDYVVTIQDNMSNANWGQYTFSGPAGMSSTSSGTLIATTNNQFTYIAESITSNEDNLAASIVDQTTPSITLTLGTMPIGGGTATVTVSGSQSAINYNFSLSIQASNPVLGQWLVNPITITAPYNYTTTGSFNFSEVADNDYAASGVSSNTIFASGTLGTGIADLFDVDYSVTMPTGGGSGVLTVDGASSSPTIHTATITYDPSYMSDNGNNHSPTFNVGTQSGLSTVITGATGDTIPFTMTLNPSPSYWVVNIPDENPITNSNGANAWQITDSITANGSGFFGPLQWNNSTDVLSGNLIMPSGGGTATLIAPKMSVDNPSYTYTVTLVENVDNLQVIGSSVYAFTGVTGSTASHTFDLEPSAGYTHNITYIQNPASGGVLSSSENNGDVLVTLNSMPQGGGSVTITVSATTTEISYPVTLNFATGSGSLTGNGGWDDSVINLNATAGTQYSIDNSWRITNSDVEFRGDSLFLVGITGTNYPSSNPFDNMLTQNPTSGDSSRTTGTFSVPIGGGTWTLTASGRTRATTTTTTLPTFTCTDFNLLFTASPGTTGNNVQYAWDGGPQPMGLNLSINPSTYQYGNYMYQAQFTIPSGYSNSGLGLTCSFSINTTTTTTTLRPFNCIDDVLISIYDGAVGSELQYSNKNNLTINSISPSTYQLGSNSYYFTIAVPSSGYGNSGFGNYIQCLVNGTGTTTTTTTTTLPQFECSDTSLSIPAGSVGSTVSVIHPNAAYSIHSVSPSTYQLGQQSYNVTVNVPSSGYGNSGSRVICAVSGTGTTTTLPRFECSDTILSIPAGSVGSSVVVETPDGAAYSINSISPTTYQLGQQSYNVKVNVPSSGYSNSGSRVICAVSGTGTTTTLPLFECSDTNIQIPNGAVGTNVLVNMNGVGSAQSVSPSTYQLGQQSYTVTVNVPAGYSNTGGTIPCDVSGTGTTTTTTTADPCIPCQADLNIDIDRYTKGSGTAANGVLVAWKSTSSDLCQFDSSNVNLYYSSTLNGTYTNLGTPNLYPYNEERTPPSSISSNNGIGFESNPSYIHNQPNGQGLDPGYYYITATNNATGSGCPDVVSPTVHMEVENTSTESSNKIMYLWGVGCDGDASESTDWFGSSGSTARSHVLLKHPGTTLNGSPNEPNQYQFTNGSGAPGMPDGHGFNYFIPHTGVTKQYWGCTDPNVLRIKVDLNTSAGRAAFDSIGTGTAYQFTGTSLSFNSDLDGKVKFCGIAIPPRQYHPGGQTLGTWGYNNSKLFRLPGSDVLENTDSGRVGATAAPHTGAPNQTTEQNATANPAFTPPDWAICHGFTADCGSLDPGRGGLTTSTTTQGGGGGGSGSGEEGEELSEDPGPGDPGPME